MYTFLIIDDEPIVREGISENIDWESHGFRLVGACRDGRDGILAVEELRPDVVLTDICMPFVDGLELAAFVADRYPDTKTILLTGYDEFEYAQEAVKLKVNDFLLKPITADELRTVLNRLRTELDDERRRQQDIDTLRQQLLESLPLLRERFLNRLVQGDVRQIEASRKLEALGIHLSGPRYAVTLIDPDCVDSEDDLRRLAIQNTAESAAARRQGAVSFRGLREQIVVLLSGRTDAETLLAAIECSEEIADKVRHSMETTVSIGIGSPVSTLALLSDSYRDARTALGQRLVLGPNQIVTAEQLRGASLECAPHAEEQARSSVIRELRGGTAEAFDEALSDLGAFYRRTLASNEECFIGMQRLLAEVLGALESLGIHHSEIQQLSANPFGRLSELKTLEAIEDWFYKLARDARAVLSHHLKQQSVSKALEAERYIADHFDEPGLSLARICRELSISKSYFSPTFKAHTGMTFVEYLTNLRMERAKQLLASTDLKSYEVAEKIGFTDAHYFSLTFRKQTGVSPSEFRESVRGELT